MAISIRRQSGIEGDTILYEYAGLSTDTKPISDAVQNGSCFIEMDTGKVYFYDAEHEEWRLFA